MRQLHATQSSASDKQVQLVLSLTKDEMERLHRLARSEGKADTTEWAKRILLSMTDLLGDVM